MANRRWKYEEIKQVMDGGNPFIQVGYTGPAEKQRKVGEVWTDVRGNTWKQTSSSTKVKVNKQADSIRELVRPRCKVCDLDINLFGDKIDKKMHAKTGMCFSCVEVEEAKLKTDGGFETYEKCKLLRNELSVAKEFRAKIVESIEYLEKDDSKISFVTQDGSIETWSGAQNESILEDAKEDLNKVDKHIQELEEEIEKLNA